PIVRSSGSLPTMSGSISRPTQDLWVSEVKGSLAIGDEALGMVEAELDFPATEGGGGREVLTDLLARPAAWTVTAERGSGTSPSPHCPGKPDEAHGGCLSSEGSSSRSP